MEQSRQKQSLGDRWSDARATKTVVFWCCAASVVLTLIIGFSWGGWVTGGTARAMAAASGDSAVVKRLAPICVTRFNAEPQKAENLTAMNELSSWQRGDYVMKHGWATMLGEQEPDRQVADECARLLTLAGQ